MALVAPGQACHQKRVVEFGEWLGEKVLKYVPHRQWVFSIPKRLRIYFMMVRNYGFYSNKSRGLRKKAGTDDQIPALIESEVSPKEFRKNWARLIQKIYNVNPLLCPKCLGSMKIISFKKEPGDSMDGSVQNWPKMV
jgi:hypothetical protein